MKLKNIAAIILTLCSAQLFAKEYITMGEDFKLAEVTGNEINIRSGAGTQFPIAHTYYTDYDGKKIKQDAGPAYKGQRLWVKDAGDWWEIDHPGTVTDGDSKQFISKKFCKLLETDTFDIASITSPQVWAYAEEQQDEEGYEYVSYNIITIYPGGLVVTQFYDNYGNNITLGKVNKEGTAVFNQINTPVSDPGNEPAPNAPLTITADSDNSYPHLNWKIGENNKSSFTYKGEKLTYNDISDIPVEKWEQLITELKKSEGFRGIRQFRTDPDAYLIYDTLATKSQRLK